MRSNRITYLRMFFNTCSLRAFASLIRLCIDDSQEIYRIIDTRCSERLYESVIQRCRNIITWRCRARCAWFDACSSRSLLLCTSLRCRLGFAGRSSFFLCKQTISLSFSSSSFLPFSLFFVLSILSFGALVPFGCFLPLLLRFPLMRYVDTGRGMLNNPARIPSLVQPQLVSSPRSLLFWHALIPSSRSLLWEPW